MVESKYNWGGYALIYFIVGGILVYLFGRDNESIGIIYGVILYLFFLVWFIDWLTQVWKNKKK